MRAGLRKGGLTLLAALVLSLLPLTAGVAAEFMQAQVDSGQVDVSGWLMSEKLDGVRAHWDGQTLCSKNGYRLTPPADFLVGWPPFALEGELWGGRGSFVETAATVQRAQDDAGWRQLRFAIFDVPDGGGPFVERLQRVQQWFAKHTAPHAFVIPQVPVRDREHMRQELARVEAAGGEGLMVRRPEAPYTTGRSAEILKVKSWQDAEAVVVAHLPGQGRHRGRLGALLVERPDGIRFRLGTGFTDAEREEPPPLGSLITYKFQGFFPSGLPRFPSYRRLRQDGNL